MYPPLSLLYLLCQFSFPQLLPCADNTVVMDNGRIFYAGPYNRRAVLHAFPTAAIAEDEIFHKDDAALSTPTNVRRVSSIKPVHGEKLLKTTQPAPVAATPVAKSGGAIGYNMWFTEMGRKLCVVSLLIFMLTQINRIISDWFISRWTANDYNLTGEIYLAIYCGLVGGFTIWLISRGLFFYKLSLGAAKTMHNRMFAVAPPPPPRSNPHSPPSA
jgi:hypothetical protein